jgi:hypothetical protein
MKKFSIYNHLGYEVDTIETSYDEEFALAVYAVKTNAPLARLKRAHYSVKLIAILL